MQVHEKIFPCLSSLGNSPNAPQDSFMYRRQYGVLSVMLDDDNCDGYTTLSMGHGMCGGNFLTKCSPVKRYGVDLLYDSFCQTPDPKYGLSLYFKRWGHTSCALCFFICWLLQPFLKKTYLIICIYIIVFYSSWIYFALVFTRYIFLCIAWNLEHLYLFLSLLQMTMTVCLTLAHLASSALISPMDTCVFEPALYRTYCVFSIANFMAAWSCAS